MNKLIVHPGHFNSSFFQNEVKYLKKYFDEVVLISYNEKDEDELFSFCNSNNIQYHMVGKNNLIYLFNRIFIKWLFSDIVKNEIKKNIDFDKHFIFKLLYVIYYGIFYIKTKEYIDNEIEKSDVDNIIIYAYWLSRPAFTAAMHNDNSKVNKVISRAHGYDLYTMRNKLNYLPFRNFIDANLDEIHFISEHGLEYFKENFTKTTKDKNKSKKYISRLGTYNNIKVNKKIKKKDYICIASCSYIRKVKRLDLIIDVIANIEYKVKWIHIGDGKLMDEIKIYAKKMLDAKDYIFLGEVKNSRILDIYKEYDVDYFINMSESEGVPVSIMEAISFGLPIIARNVGGNSEIVTKNGLLIDSMEDKEEVFNIINSFVSKRVNNLNAYLNQSQNSLNLWNEKYHADINYESFFKNLLK